MGLHGLPVSIVLNHDAHFILRFLKSFQEVLETSLKIVRVSTHRYTERTNQVMEDMLMTCAIDLKVLRRNSCH